MTGVDVTGKRVALVGGAGFIGHHLALELKARGAEPVVIDGLQVNNLGAFSSTTAGSDSDRYLAMIHQRLELLRAARIPLSVVDARDYPLLGRTIEEIDPEVIVHLAAVAHAGKSNKDPYTTFDHSARTLENALDVARNISAHFIFFSSSMVYGDFHGSAVEEDRHCEPYGIYGALKFGGERLVIAYNQIFGLPYTIIRPSALYGERCVSRRVSQVFIERALDGLPLKVNGDGTESLDFTYINDLVNGVILCISNDSARQEIFNLTFGEGRSLKDLAEIISGELPQTEVEYLARDDSMPERGRLSIVKARDLLGYSPEWPLEQGYLRYLRWYQEGHVGSTTL